jgi:capsular polysaccharide biosynthesis protein
MQGSIYSKNGHLVKESVNWHSSNFYKSFPWNPKKNLTKITAPNVINLTTNTYGHWLIEDLASTLYLTEKFPNSPVIVEKNASRFVHQFLEKIDREVIFCNGPVMVDSLLTITKREDSGWMHPRDFEILTKFKDSVLVKSQIQNLRIYATRRLLKRSPKNEKDIEYIFRNHNFTVMQLEELNFFDEINLLNQTKILAGVHGSWAFNCIWMEKNSSVFEIVNKNYWTELIHRVCSMNQINYKWYKYGGAFNSIVDLKQLEEALEQVV